MDIVFPFQQLDCYVVARDFARLVQQAAIADTELRDQVTRAAKSVFLNVSEGLPTAGSACGADTSISLAARSVKPSQASIWPSSSAHCQSHAPPSSTEQLSGSHPSLAVC